MSILKKKEEKEEKKSLYLDDRPTVEDEFDYNQIADTLKEVIKQQDDFPTHISLMGEWGSGKSTVIKLLKESLKEEKRIAIKEFSVWKYSDDTTTLQRRIIRQVKQELKSKKNKQEEKDFSSKMDDSIEEKNVMLRGNNIGALLVSPFTGDKKISLLLIALLIMQLLFLIIQPFKDWVTVNLPFMLVLYLGFSIFNKVGITVSKATKTALRPMVYDDQFENEFRSTVSNYTKNKIDKLVLVFDDLDRLPPNQLYSALNTIKTFLKADKCIFIVPCDERVLRDELEHAFESKQSTVDVSEFLNKTFDVTIKLPMVEKNNMRRYAINLLESNNVKWYRSEKIQEHIHSIISTLIHSEINTPRKVKKNLNAFASDWYLAEKRDNSSGSNILTSHPREIAIMTVIKTNYLKFYEIIQEHPLLFKQLKEREKDIKSSEALTKYLSEVIESTRVNIGDRNSHKVSDYDQENNEEELNVKGNITSVKVEDYIATSFLKRVFPQLPEDSRPYLYFSNKSLNPITSIPRLNEIKESLLNADVETFSELFEDINEESKWVLFNSVHTEFFGEMDERNALTTIIALPSTGMYTKQNTYWEEKLREHVHYLAEESDPKEVYQFLRNMEPDDSTRNLFGEALIEIRPTKSLIELWVEYPEARDFLRLEGLTDQVDYYNADLAVNPETAFTVPRLIFTLEETHPLTKELHWEDLMQDVLITINKQNDKIREDNEELEEDEKEELMQYKPEFRLHDWIQNVNHKSNKFIDVITLKGLLLKINKYIDSYSNDFLDGVGEYWESVIRQTDNDKEVKETIKILSTNPSLSEILLSDDLFDILNSKYAKFNSDDLNQGVSDEIYDLLTYFEENDEDKLINVLDRMRDIAIVHEWSIDALSLSESTKDKKVIDVIIHNERRISISSLYESIDDKFDFKDSSVISSVKAIVENANRIYEYGVQEGYFEKWFDIHPFDDSLKISQDNYKSFLSLKDYVTPNKREFANFLERVITLMLQKSALVRTSDASIIDLEYRNQWKEHLNITFVELSHSGNFVDWSKLLNEWKKVTVEGTGQETISILDQLSSSTIDQTLPLIDNNSPKKDIQINELISKYSVLSHLSHTDAIANRWLEFTSEQREEIITKMEKEFYNLFMKKFLTNLKVQPDLNYITQLQNEEFHDDSKEQIVTVIITNSKSEDLSRWVNDIYEERKNELNHWVYEAFNIIANKKLYLEPVDLALLRDSLTAKNNKTKVTLKLIPLMYSNKDADKARLFIREILFNLEDDKKFSELAKNLKSMFGFRKPKHRFKKIQSDDE